MYEREKKILGELDRKNRVKVNELSELFQCSQVTIRRDLIRLEEAGLLKRTHGGAEKTGSNFVDKDVNQILYNHLSDKVLIAKKAYQFIEADDILFLDDASTCIYLAGEIKKHKENELTIITNSILLAYELMKVNHVKLLLLGGEVVSNLYATAGTEVVEQIQKYHATKAFIGVNGIDFEIGVTGKGFPQAKVKREMIRHSKETYILADSSKFGHTYLSHICNINELKGIISNRGVKDEYIEASRKMNISLILA